MWDKFQARLFITKLHTCQDNQHLMNSFDYAFVQDMAAKYKSRADSEHLGIEQWEPTAKQLNYLESIANKYR